jgi:hypothetical protein
MAVQLIVGRAEPVFPHFIMTRRLPTKQLRRLGDRAIHVLKYLERAVHPRWPMTFDVAKRAADDRVAQIRNGAFLQGLQQAGWNVGATSASNIVANRWSVRSCLAFMARTGYCITSASPRRFAAATRRS